MKNLIVKLGEIQRYHDAANNYEKTLELLRTLKAGEVPLECVELTDNGWLLKERSVTIPAPIKERMNGTPETVSVPE